ncbi:hypothetical protein IGI53_000420 [Enterococcus sp. DIV0788_1]
MLKNSLSKEMLIYFYLKNNNYKDIMYQVQKKNIYSFFLIFINCLIFPFFENLVIFLPTIFLLLFKAIPINPCLFIIVVRIIN